LAIDLAALGTIFLKQSNWTDAEPVLRECLAIRENTAADDWSRFHAMALLGGALLGQGKFAEAEPLVVGGYEGIKAREVKLPAYERRVIYEAADQVVRLYEAWGRKDKVAAWKAELGLADLPANVFARPGR
jgi:hypothetical protein